MQQVMRLTQEKKEQARKKVLQDKEEKRRRSVEANYLAIEELRKGRQSLRTADIKKRTADQVSLQQKEGQVSKEQQDRMLQIIDDLNSERESYNDLLMGDILKDSDFQLQDQQPEDLEGYSPVKNKRKSPKNRGGRLKTF